MHVSPVFDLVAAVAEIGLHSPPLSLARRRAGGSFHETAAGKLLGAARLSDGPARGAVLSMREDPST